MGQVCLRLLVGEAEEMLELQRVLEEAPAFSQRVTGCLPGAADAQSTYSDLPEGKSYEDKFTFGIFRDEKMVGCLDLIRNYPEVGSAWIGLLLISETCHGQGIGRAACDLLLEVVQSWHCCSKIKLAVVSTNSLVLPFWQKMGFRENGERRPYRHQWIKGESIHMERPL